MTQPTASSDSKLPIQPAPTLAQLIPVYQAMQAVLAYPPSEELNKLVTDTLTRTTDPLMIGFLNLLITGDQGHRDIAAQIFHQLEIQLAEARQRQRIAAANERVASAAEQAAALVKASPVVETLIKTLDAPTSASDETGEVPYTPTHDELMAAWARQSSELRRPQSQGEATRPMRAVPLEEQQRGERYSAEADDAAHYGDRGEATVLEEPAANVVTLQSRRERAVVPYVAQEGEHYTLRYSDKEGTVTKEEVYSIITENTRFDASPEEVLHQLCGVVIGIQNQATIEHGFGYVLPLDGMAFLPADKSLHIPLRLEYPSAMPIYDDHNAANVTGLKEFMALHEAMKKGYTVCLDLYVKVNTNPNRGNSLLLTLRQEKLILRRQVTTQGYSEDGAMFSSLDLEDLHLATKKLALVGIFAKH